MQILRLLRPTHWLKNLFVVAPVVFGKQLFDGAHALDGAAAFAGFSFLSSAVYILNDLRDRAADAQHPLKRYRPLAAGTVSTSTALLLLALLVCGAAAAAAVLPWRYAACLALYAVLNVGYSFGLKHVVILDIFIIAAGFMLRVVAGASAVAVAASSWIVVCTLFLALFLAVSKRRAELNLVERRGLERSAARAVLDDYTPELIATIRQVSLSGAIMSYTLYTVSDHVVEYFGSRHLVYTIPIVLYGLFRYLALDERRDGGENPIATVLRDPWLSGAVVAWGLAVVAAIYLPSFLGGGR